MEEDECSCPIPCKQTIYDPAITHATLSQFDRQKILLTKKQLRDNLQRKFHAARETRQRVDTDIITHDEDRLLRFLSAATKLEATFESLRNLSKRMLERAISMFKVWQTNYLFHRYGALHFMEYMIKHNFHRGWDVIDERTFRYLTFDYLAFLAKLKLNLGELVRTENMTSEKMLSYRDVITWQIKEDLSLRVEVTERGLSNMTKIYNGYATGMLLSIYKYTKVKKYDHLNTPLCLQSKLLARRNKVIYNGMKMYLETMIDTLQGFMNITKDVCEGRGLDSATYGKLAYIFSKYSRGINYRLFIYKDRVVDYSLRETEAKLVQFDQLTSKLEELKHQLDSELQTMGDSIAQFLDTDWKHIVAAKLVSSQYLRDKSVKKSKLAETILSEKLLASVQALKKVIPDVVARSRSLRDTTRRLKEATFSVYYSIMTENCSNILYGYLRNDTDRIRENRTYLDDKTRHIFKELLDNMPRKEGERVITSRDIGAMSADELAKITNADLPTLQEKDSELELLFARFQQDIDFNQAIDNADVNFTNIFQELKEVLSDYTRSGQINTDFLR
jgi:hypothetical protein